MILVTGGCGYIGALVVEELLADGQEVCVLDRLLHGQQDIAAEQERAGVRVICADLRDADARASALAGAGAVVHMAAIVGDPACAHDPELSEQVNVQATRALVDEACAMGAKRFLFASTCSNYGRMADPTVPVAEDGDLRPVSLYAKQKVAIETLLLEGASSEGMACTCLRFATVYGVGRRMRFDLTVNEFARDLWADLDLEVFGERFWRPYVHVRDAARAVLTVLRAPADRVSGQVFNVGRSSENYRKLDLVEQIRKQVDGGRVAYVPRAEDPRDYKVSFEKIRAELAFEALMTVPDGIAEVLGALDAGKFEDPFDERYRNPA
ncbi:MAG TPA: SDR family oxidoreductase [Solirubrobacteraceae bacterium]|jgi:nucleoside-diphosphate-sugar epimerase|nr:SDR family oxidoreductase [Solirubrobacteraceae bacterium]